MRRSRPVCAVLVALALAACAPQQGQKFEVGPESGGPQPSGQPAQPTDQPAPSQPAPPQVTRVTVSLDQGGSQPVSTVAPDAAAIYAVWSVEGVSAPVDVRGRWLAVNVEGVAPDTVLSEASQTIDRSGGGAFPLARPSDGWKPGSYRVEVSAGGVARSAGFVIAAPAAGSQPPGQPGAAQPAASPVEAALARGATDAGEPTSPGTEFPEDAEKIYLTVRSTAAEPVHIVATWIAVNVETYEPNKELTRTSASLPAGGRAAMWVSPPRGGFQPGDYRVDLSAGGTAARSLPFRVVPLLPPAALVTPADQPRGIDVALAALGGRLESSTSEYDASRWAAANLIDGSPEAWSSRDNSVPQEIVLSFYKGREPEIAGVVIDPATSETLRDPSRIGKHVEVWTSNASRTDGFTRVAGARLHPRPAEQFIAVPPTRAKYVKIRFTSNHGGPYVQAGEVRVLESQTGASILADLPRNIALAGLGGSIVRFTSQRGTSDNAARLLDGAAGSGWRSADGYLPQDVVIAFRGDLPALVDRVVLNPAGDDDRTTWVKAFTVSVSDHPLDGFQEVGQFTLAQQPGDQAFPVGRRARFVRIRMLSNGGSRSRTTLGEVKVIEGGAPGYVSVLVAPVSAVSTSAAPGDVQVDERAVAPETEPNDAAAQANRLEFGRRVKGTIDPLGEQDHYRLTMPDRSVLTLELLGRPYIRTSLALSDASGTVLKRFDPGRVPGNRAEFSWQLPAGGHTVMVTEPAVSIVLIWDTSGSMSASYRDLETAVGAYLDQVRPTERLQLIRFSDQVEQLTSSFTSDRDALKAAAAGKFFARGGTPFYDAVARGIRMLDGVAGNRAIIVMTDGEDTGSQLTYPEFWKLLEEQRIRLYTIALGDQLQKSIPQISTSPNRMMTHVAAATNGRFFFARTSEELAGLYQRIADELRTTSTYYLRATVSRGQGTLAVNATGERIAAVSAPPQVELILDASGSMKRQIDGRPMMDIAKDVMSGIIKGLPDDMRAAMRFYGHRIREGRPGDCRDSELVFPFRRIDRAAMLARVRAVRALGTTPIAYTLRQVARDFGSAPGEKLVILVTDGKEECGGSPSAVVSEMVARGIKVRLNIVGFALAEAEVRQEMERVAKITGGKFFDARNARALRQAIEQSLAVPYDVLDAAGARVGGGLTGQGTVRLPEGIYTVVVRAAGKRIEIRNVRVRADAFTKVALKKEGQEIGVRVIGP